MNFGLLSVESFTDKNSNDNSSFDLDDCLGSWDLNAIVSDCFGVKDTASRLLLDE